MDNNVDKKVILVVEDKMALQEALKMKLEKAGISVLTASTGEEALEVLQKNKPTMVSLDILLPKMNGIEVLRKIRENPKLHDLPVVILSVSGGQEKIKQAFALSVVDYLIKSEYKIGDVIKKLQEILEDYS